MHSGSQELGTLYRTPARIVAAESKEELLRLLSHTLKTLYRNFLRFEVFLADESGRLVVARTGEACDVAVAPIPGTGHLRDVSVGRRYEPALHGVGRGFRMSAPLRDGHVELGLIVVEAAPGEPFGAMDLEVLEGVASLFSLAFERLNSRKSERRRDSIEADRRSAGSVQRSLMKTTLPVGSGLKVDARYQPALDVGGDFYDLACLGDGRIGGAIGDVSGKGVSAALIMSRVSSDLGRVLRSGATPSEVLESINTTMTDAESETFVTASCITLDPRSRSLTIANAGHIPLMIRRANGEVFDFGGASGTPLGMMPCRYVDERLELQPLDIVLLMTDGLVEALDLPSDRMGTQRLHRIVNTAPHDPAIINARILAAANESNGAQTLDDVTLLALQVESR
jgi:sigma-B regulation protein RsbU (phosphoserine phosphatase)